MEELVERAWREHLRITVCAERDEAHRPLSSYLRPLAQGFKHKHSTKRRIGIASDSYQPLTRLLYGPNKACIHFQFPY